MNEPAIPPQSVLEAFGGSGEITSLPGGAETSLLVGDVVLKQVLDVSVSAWSQLVLATTRPDRFLIPPPLAASDGSWTVNGWIATKFIDNLTPLRSQPNLVIDVGKRFADAVAAANVSDFGAVLSRTDRWAVADRLVWNDEELDFDNRASELAETLRTKMGSRSDLICVIMAAEGAPVWKGLRQ